MSTQQETSFSEHELSVLKKQFDVYDIDGNGTISYEEFNTVSSIFVRDKIDQNQILDLFNMTDLDKNGDLEFDEFVLLMEALLRRGVRSKTDLIQDEIIKRDCMSDLKNLLKVPSMFNVEKTIATVIVLVVVLDEILPLVEKYNPVHNEEMTKEFLGLATVSDVRMEDENGAYNLTFLQVATSKYYKRHYSGFTQSAAITSLAVKFYDPDLFISFGTAGGISGLVEVGDVVIGQGCVFLDRFRTSSKNSFDWGIYGGPAMDSKGLAANLGLKSGILASQISYHVSDVQKHLIDLIGICALDMECAPESQVLQQTGTNFLPVKVISNFVYPGEPLLMEEEYIKNKLFVSEQSMIVLEKLFSYLIGKTVQDLGDM